MRWLAVLALLCACGSSSEQQACPTGCKTDTQCPLGYYCAAQTACVDACPGSVHCGGTCADRFRNCIACGQGCSTGQVCSAGACKSQCDTGLVNCSGVCSDLNEDANCGACGNVCPHGQVCGQGQCGPPICKAASITQ